MIRIKLLTHLDQRIGEEFHAIVVGVEDFGIFCRLVELPVEGLVHVTSLADDYYYLEPGTHTLVGRSSGRRHRLGDRIAVRVAHVDVDRRELDLVLAGSAISRGRRTRSPATGGSAPVPGRGTRAISGLSETEQTGRRACIDRPGETRGSEERNRKKKSHKAGREAQEIGCRPVQVSRAAALSETPRRTPPFRPNPHAGSELLVPTLRVGMPSGTLRVRCDS